MDTYAVTLRPRGSYLGAITSQTLFGAVCWALSTMNVLDVSELLRQFQISPQFVFSSAFPYLSASTGHIRFYPMPALAAAPGRTLRQMAAARAGAEAGQRFKQELVRLVGIAKQLKGVRYVSQAIMNDVCAGRCDAVEMVRQWNSGVELLGNALWSKEERTQAQELENGSGRTVKPKPGWASISVRRNATDRVAGATAEGLLFQEIQTFLMPGRAGLWFVVRCLPDAWPWLEAAFRYLADTGLGAKRSVGKGHFDFDWQAAPDLLPGAAHPDSFITLSQYVPKFQAGHAEAPPRSYSLVAVQQKAENKFPGSEHMRAHIASLRVFAEGSVFAATVSQPYYGRLIPLTHQPVDGRSIYYNGLALPVFAQLGGSL